MNKVLHISKLVVLLFLFTQVFVVNGQGFKHPGLLHTQEDFERINMQLAENNAAVVAGMSHLRSSEWSQLSVGTWPSEIIKRGVAGDENYINAARGAHIAYMCALRWKLGDGEAYAKKAVEVLNAWAATTTGIGGNSNYALASGLYGYEFANAGELLRDYEGWDRKDFKAYQDWMKGVWYPVALGFLTGRNGTNPGHYWSNWGLCNALCITSIGVLCDDMYIYNQGLSYYKDDYIGTFKEDKTGDAKIINDGYNEFIGNLVPVAWQDDRGPFGQLGQMQESGRDQGHTLMALGLATDICQTAWNQGEDLFAYMDNRLAAGVEYVAAYNTVVENEDLPWKDYWYHDVRTTVENSWKQTENNAGGRGQHRPYWDRLLGYYEGIKGVEMPYASIMADNIRNANSGADYGGYGGTSGGYDHLGYSTLTCTRPSITTTEAQTTLGMYLIYDGETYNSSARLTFQPGSSITLVPTLPDTVTNTGNWLWDTGATTQQLEITADSSFIYRVYYTNANGVVSSQAFSIFVYGDCPTDVYQYLVISNNGITEDTVITVQQYSKVNLSLKSLTGQSTFLWNTGETSSDKQADIEKADTSFTVTGTNKGGASYQLTFTIKVEPMGTRYQINDGDLLNGNKLLVVKNQKATLIPEVKTEIEGGTWLWNNGSTTKDLVLDNIEENAEYSVVYTYNDNTYTATYSLVVVEDTSSVAYWPFDEGTGSIATDVWAGFNGQLLANDWTTAGAKYGAVELSGETTSYVELGDNILGTLEDFTISVWVKPTSLENWSRIFDFGSGTDYYMFLTPQSDAGYVRFVLKSGDTDQAITATQTLELDKWSHLVITKEGNVAKLYIDGSLAGTQNNMTLNPSDLGYTTQNYLGKSQYDADPMFEGTIDELKIYNRAFSLEEITDLRKDTEPYEATYKITGYATEYGKNISMLSGESVRFSPVVKRGMLVSSSDGISWLWSTGGTSRTLTLNNITTSQNVSVTYTFRGEEFTINYAITIKAAENMVGYWPMNETLGTTAQDEWSGLNATLNGATWTTVGKCDGAIAFDGSSSYVQLPDGFLRAVSDFTIAAWVNPTASSTWARIWDFGSDTDYNMFLTPVASDGYVRFAIKAGGNEQQTTTTSKLPLNQWSHIAVTKSGYTVSIYINGTLVGSNTAITISPSALGSTTQNYLGKSQWPDPLFKGSIDELKIYNEGLDQSAVTELMSCGTQTGVPTHDYEIEEMSIIPTVSSTGDFIIINPNDLSAIITVYDLTGTVVKTVRSASTETQLYLPESKMYLVKVTTKRGSSVFKILKR